MAPEIIELRPNRSLLKDNFEGYKLSLQTTPIIKYDITSKPLVLFPNDEQYSLLDATLFALHNHLYSDPWAPYNTYFIDESFNIKKLSYHPNAGSLKPEENIFSISRSTEKACRPYNASMKFITEKYVLISEGTSGNLHLIETKDRLKYTNWESISNIKVSDFAFIILDARLEINEVKKQIHCLLLRVDKDSKGFHNIIEWVVLSQPDTAIWLMTGHKQLKGYGALHYCALEHKCEAVIISSDQRFKFLLDTDNPIEEKESTSIIDNTQISEIQSNSEDEASVHITWCQSEEDITIIFKCNQIIKEEYLNVKLTATHLKVTYWPSNTWANEELFDRVEPKTIRREMISPSVLYMTLQKQQPSKWLSFCANINDGFKEVTKIKKINKHLKNMRAETSDSSSVEGIASFPDELDDCDYDQEFDIKELGLERLSVTDHKASHFVHIGTVAPLFSITLLPGAPPAVAIRHDVDALLWEIPKTISQWPPRHHGTLPAFGYVQASKKKKKFITCAPDLSYSVICDSDRHIFLYWGSVSGEAGQLQNRKNKQCVNVGQQKVIALESVGEVIGLQAENDAIILLTSKCIAAIQLHASE